MENTTASRLKKALSLRGMKQIELSEKTGIGKSAISQYLSGKIVPKQDKIYLMAHALDINEGWLMGYDVSMNRYSHEDNNSSLPELNKKDEREISSDLEDMMNSMSSAAYESNDGFEDIEAFKATIKAAMIQAKRIAKKKYTPKKYRKE